MSSRAPVKPLRQKSAKRKIANNALEKKVRRVRKLSKVVEETLSLIKQVEQDFQADPDSTFIKLRSEAQTGSQWDSLTRICLRVLQIRGLAVTACCEIDELANCSSERIKTQAEIAFDNYDRIARIASKLYRSVRLMEIDDGIHA